MTEGSRVDSVDEAAHIDTVKDGQRIDDIDIDAHSDNSVEGKRIDTTEEAAYNDSIESGERNDEDKHGERHDTYERHYKGVGNVGTMTTQDMIKQEREIALFSIFEIIARDIISQIACTVY